MNNAERQKRYRDKKRNAPGKASVTLPDGSTVIEPLRALHGMIGKRNAPDMTASEVQARQGGYRGNMKE